MGIELFSKEYNYIKGFLGSETFSDPLDKEMASLKPLLGDEGPLAIHAGKLDTLRLALAQKEAERIIKAAGVNGNTGGTPVIKASVIKFLRHLYNVGKKGSQSVWVHSSPKAYEKYISDELWAVSNDLTQLTAKLDDDTERFDKTARKYLQEATQTGLAWCHRAQMTLTLAKRNANGDQMAIVKRWFAEPTTTDAALNTVIDKLLVGFKTITATINSNLIVFTDMATIRGATSGKAKDLLNSEAFVASGRHEKIPIVYIEDAFFKAGGNVLAGPKNWARIVVHELTHLDMSTKDELYAWAGIKPGFKITAAQCAVNADSWAYFAADCAGALSKSDIERAMKGI